MTAEMERLERELAGLRADLRRAVAAGERDRSRDLRARMREAQRRWEEALADLEAPAEDEGQAPAEAAPGPRSGHRDPTVLPVREQVHQVLTLLGAPASPRLIVSVHEAFFAGRLPAARLTSLRRDEERSFRTAPYARPYYICAALTADLLAPARGLLAVSTWPMSRRVIGPLSPRVDYLTAAIRIAERFSDISDASADSRRLLWRFAANIPRAADNFGTIAPDEIVAAARAELAIHEQADSELRAAAARRARDQLDDAEQLFGAGLRLTGRGEAHERGSSTA
jgi:hypothetical protein